jgi:uncharacterized membrane protein
MPPRKGGASGKQGIAALALLPRGWPASIREAVAWDLSATIYLVLAFRVMLTCKGDVIRAHAARQDDSRVVILVIILLASGQVLSQPADCCLRPRAHRTGHST